MSAMINYDLEGPASGLIVLRDMVALTKSVYSVKTMDGAGEGALLNVSGLRIISKGVHEVVE